MVFIMQETSQLRIGVDGGGTSCRAALDMGQGAALVERRGGPANVTRFDPAIANIRETLLALTADAGLTHEQLAVTSVHLGLAGVLRSGHAERVVAAVRGFLPAGRITVSDDRVTTLAGALGGRSGALAAIGTGSFLGRRAGGQVQLLGGWGLTLGDDASGAWLGLRLLQSVLLGVDGLAPRTDLTETVLEGFQRDPSAIVGFAATAQPVDHARFAPQIVAAAKAGDEVGRSLMQAGADYILRGLRAMGWTPAEPLCLTGGMGRFYGDWLGPEAAKAVVPAMGTALDGALALAADSRGAA
jgi:glucosamine kinase